MSSDCPYCEEPHLNFCDNEERVEMWIEKTYDSKHVISVDSSPYVWSIQINYCPFCGRKLKVDE